MVRWPGRFWSIPLVAAGLAAVLAVGTRVEQDRQVAGVRSLYESHAAFVGRLVRESAQEATWATDLVYTLTAEGTGDLLELVGAPGPGQDCGSLRDRVADVAVWAARDADGVRGCLGPIPPGEARAFVDAVLASPEPGFVDTGLTRQRGVYCAADPDGTPPAILCRDRQRLDALRRQVGLGPLLSSLTDRHLDYVVIQDATGLLAASPHPGALSSWADDPVLRQTLKAKDDAPQGRLLSRDGAPVYEVVGPIELGDGTRAVVRTGLDASELAALQRRIHHRRVVMGLVLTGLVSLSAAAAGFLARADRRRRGHLAAMRRQEEEARHWRSLGQMAATVAHELRNPLNTLGMALQRLRAETRPAAGDESDFADLLEVSMEASQRMDRVVGDFLELGRPVALERLPWPAEALVREALAPLALRAGSEGKRLEVDCGCGTEVDVDRTRFAQIMANLVGNALDAVGPGGTVRVQARCDGDGFAVEVADDGPGMDEATLERVQEPFVTTRAKGTGLGLPLARRLAEAHGGSLTLRSEPGRGTVATMVLPRGGTA